MIVHHGSGGVTDERERRYARELVKMGVAALVLDSFAGRGVTSTVRDQAAVSNNDMIADAFAALKLLAAHARIDAAPCRHRRFLQGRLGGSARCARAARCAGPAGGPALCAACAVLSFLRPRSTTSPRPRARRSTCCWVVPIPMWASRPARSMPPRSRPRARASKPLCFQVPCTALTAADAYQNPRGENYSRCIFAQQPDGSWKERGSGAVTHDASSKPIEAGHSSRRWPSVEPWA